MPQSLRTSDFAHGLSGYKRKKCRCETCSEAYEQYRIKERLKYRRTPIKHHLIDATPLIELYREFATKNGRRIVKKWEDEGISVYDADTYCMKLGLHPIEVFGAHYFEGLAEEEEQYRNIYGEMADV